MRELLHTGPALILLGAVVLRGVIQHRHPFFMFVAAIVGTACVLCVARSLARGESPGNMKIVACDRYVNPFGYWFNVTGWSLCYLGMLWLAWSIPPL